jgi:hypothetical protein
MPYLVGLPANRRGAGRRVSAPTCVALRPAHHLLHIQCTSASSDRGGVIMLLLCCSLRMQTRTMTTVRADTRKSMEVRYERTNEQGGPPLSHRFRQLLRLQNDGNYN